MGKTEHKLRTRNARSFRRARSGSAVPDGTRPALDSAHAGAGPGQDAVRPRGAQLTDSNSPLVLLVQRNAGEPLLTREEERALTYEARNGTEEERRRAREALVVRNLRLVMKWASRYRGTGLPFEDLVQEGTTGLLRALELYDPDRGVKFGTYASWWIRQAIQRAVSQKSRVVRLPVYLRDRTLKLKRARSELSHALGRDPSEEELAAALGLDAGEVRLALEADAFEPVSLQALVPSGGDGSRGAAAVGDFVADPAEENEHEGRAAEERDAELHALLARVLSDEERHVIERRYGLVDGRDPASLKETADELGLGKKAVAKTQRAAEDKLHRSALVASLARGRVGRSG